MVNRHGVCGMKPSMGAWLVVILAVGCTSNPPEESEARLLTLCPEDAQACVRMTVDLADSTLLLSVSEPDSAGYAEFRIMTAGLIDGPSTLVVHGHVEGLWCSDFGQATVAAIAEEPDGHVRVLTRSGSVALPPNVLTVGCPDCLHDLESGNKYRTPGWDLKLAGYAWDAVAMLTTGEPVVLTADACFTLSGRFRRMPRDRCESNLALKERTFRQAIACT